MAAESNTSYMKKRFGHCVINWKIENYCLATCREEWIINSPDFNVSGPQTTKWKMVLKPKLNVNDSYFITLYLQRIDFDPGPDSVWVNWRLTFMYKLGKEDRLHHTEECEHYFNRKSNYGVDLTNISITFRKSVPLDQDTLYIRCQLIVSPEDATRKFDISSDTALKSLSQNLKALYESNAFHDILIRTEDKELRSHKAVLYARNRTFASLIDQTKGNTPIPLRLKCVEVEKVITFLYSGDLQFLLSKPSIALYECIMYFKIEEITSYFSPDEYVLNTAVDAQDFIFRWLITDFSTRNEDWITSPIFNGGTSETCWTLQLKMKREEEYKCKFIHATFAANVKPMNVYAEFCIMNNNEKFISLGRFSKSIKGSEMIYFDDNVLNELLENSLRVNNAFHAYFKLRISKGTEVSTVGCQVVPFISKAERQYQSLSMDMAGMYVVDKFQDISLLAGGSTFRAHKCVLASRSRVFARNIDTVPKNGEFIDTSNCSPKAFQIFLYYIYCGVLKDFKIGDIVEVYGAAHLYEVCPLKEACSLILQSNVELKSACNILIFAEKIKDKDLKLSALKFVSINGLEIIKQQCWLDFIADYPLLASEVRNYINSYHQKCEVFNRNKRNFVRF